MKTKKMIKLVAIAIGLVASVATFFAGFAFKNVGLGVIGVLSFVPNLMYLLENVNE